MNVIHVCVPLLDLNFASVQQIFPEIKLEVGSLITILLGSSATLLTITRSLKGRKFAGNLAVFHLSLPRLPVSTGKWKE